MCESQDEIKEAELAVARRNEVLANTMMKLRDDLQALRKGDRPKRVLAELGNLEPMAHENSAALNARREFRGIAMSSAII
eukprot:SAG11_NODE_485_length_9035_cov_16.221352_1_plen_80_part_00